MPSALVTGAASGIGRATLSLLRSRGYNAFGTDVSTNDAHPDVIAADVSSSADWDRVASIARERLGLVHLAHLNAGVPSRQSSIALLTDVQLERTMAVNFAGVAKGVRALLPVMAADSDIIVTASIAGMRATRFDPVYTASKHA